MTAASSKPIAELPEDGYVRKAQLVGGIVPVSDATFWRWVKDGRFPPPVKLSPGVSAWPVQAVRDWIAKQGLAHAA